MNWTENKSYLAGIENTMDEIITPVRIASFDLDDTIIEWSRGKSTGWTILDPSVCDRIAELVDSGYIIVIFTNQSGTSSGRALDVAQWERTADKLVKKLLSKTKTNQYYFAIYVARSYDLYRKPNVAMWDLMKKHLKNEFDITKLTISKKSFYCGDAAGRESADHYKSRLYPTSNKGDFSDSDLKFALNVGVNFVTPEEFYLNQEPIEPTVSGFNPMQFVEETVETECAYQFKPRSKEMIIMVGMPGSGKSELVSRFVTKSSNKYIHINQDKCKTKQNCLKQTAIALDNSKSVVIDNTNPSVETRAQYIELARNHGYKNIRAIVMETDESLAQHLNNVRHVSSNGAIPKLNKITYNVFKKNYVEPTKSEHFDKIEHVDIAKCMDFVKLNNPKWRRIFMMWSSA